LYLGIARDLPPRPEGRAKRGVSKDAPGGAGPAAPNGAFFEAAKGGRLRMRGKHTQAPIGLEDRRP